MQSFSFNLGQSFTSYGLLCALALFVALMAVRFFTANKATYGTWLKMALLSVPLSYGLSRVVYLLATIDYYVNDIQNVAAMWNVLDGGFSMMGALLGFILSAWLVDLLCADKQLTMTDAAGLAFPVAIVLLRLAEVGTGLGEGDAVWEGFPAFLACPTEDGPVHAVYLYEAIAAAAVFVAVLCFTRLSRTKKPGDSLLMSVMLFAFTQVFLESLRNDGHMVIHMGIHVQQIIAAVLGMLVIICWWVKGILRRVRPWISAVTAAVAVAAVSVAIWSEFGVDRWESRPLAYAVMLTCLTVLCVLGEANRRLALKKEDN